MNNNQRLAAELAQSTAPYVFALPGSGASLEVIDALQARGVNVLTTLFEGSAAIMAGTVGRLTGRPGVAIGIKGPGLANMIPGLAACYLEHWPMVAIVEAYGPNVGAEKAHKRLDQGQLVEAVSKARRYASPSGPSVLDLADFACQETPGPVVLELAGDVQTDEPLPAKLPIMKPDGTPIAFIEKAKCPVVIAGSLAIRIGLSDALANLSVPVFTTATAKGVIDETLPYAAGVYTGVGLELAPESTLLDEADLIIAIGLRTSEILKAGGFSSPVIVVDDLDGVAPGLEAAAAAPLSELPSILAALSKHVWGAGPICDTHESLRKAVLARSFNAAHVYDAAQEQFGTVARMVLDTGYFCTIGEHMWQAKSSQLYLSSGSGRYMGMATATAISAAFADKEVPTLLAIGDGGIGMYFGELRLAVEHKLPLLVLFFSDGGFGSVRTRAIKSGLNQTSLLTPGRPWRDAAAALGLSVSKADGPKSLSSALAKWNSKAGPGFIEINFDPDDYQAMVEGVR